MELHERVRFARHGRSVVVGIAALAVVLSACSSDSTPAAPPATTQGTTPGTTTENPLADAKSAVVDFFEAKAVNDYDKALARSSGAAALTVRWARDVNAPQATKGTPYEVPTVGAPNIRVQIDDLQKAGTNMWNATGFVELGFRPSGVASTTTTTAPGATTTADTNVFVTDLTFSDDGSGHLRLDDFRLDDTPYPVSQLYIAATSGASTTGTTGTTGAPAGSPVALSLAHRDLDGSVQYDLSFTSPADGSKPTTATFFADVTTVPTSGATGTSTTLYADAANAGAVGPFLVVRPGAFPGGPGVLRVAFGPPASDSGTGSADVEIPTFPALVAQPVNQVRDRISSTTSSSTSSTSSSSSSTTSSSTSTSTSAPSSSSTTSSRPSSSTSSSSTSSTTSSSTTTSTAAP